MVYLLTLFAYPRGSAAALQAAVQAERVKPGRVNCQMCVI